MLWDIYGFEWFPWSENEKTCLNVYLSHLLIEDDLFLFSGILLQSCLPLWASDNKLLNTVVFLIILPSFFSHRDLDKAMRLFWAEASQKSWTTDMTTALCWRMLLKHKLHFACRNQRTNSRIGTIIYTWLLYLWGLDIIYLANSHHFSETVKQYFCTGNRKWYWQVRLLLWTLMTYLGARGSRGSKSLRPSLGTIVLSLIHMHWGRLWCNLN